MQKESHISTLLHLSDSRKTNIKALFFSKFTAKILHSLQKAITFASQFGKESKFFLSSVG
jgi:hypothetical protein